MPIRYLANGRYIGTIASHGRAETSDASRILSPMTSPSTDLQEWLPYRKARPDARIRLFCFAYAGGTASMFRGWQERLPSHVEVCAVQLPGRESRIQEPPLTRMKPL